MQDITTLLNECYSAFSQTEEYRILKTYRTRDNRLTFDERFAIMEKTLESPLDCKEIQPVHSKGDQSWVFIGRTNAKAEIPIRWSPRAKS